MNKERDERLIDEYLEGNDDSLKELFGFYTTSIYNFVYRFVGENYTDDVVQDTFIKVWKNIKKFDKGKSSFKTWVFTIARNTTIDFLKKKKMFIFSDLGNDEENFENQIKDEADLPDEILSKIEDEKMLNNFINELPFNYREVLVLYYQEDMTFKEIGEALGKPLNTVKSYHYRALVELRKKIAPNYQS
jgi:RNA polymerase sigma-70 factor (ECF subfamily)